MVHLEVHSALSNRFAHHHRDRSPRGIQVSLGERSHGASHSPEHFNSCPWHSGVAVLEPVKVDGHDSEFGEILFLENSLCPRLMEGGGTFLSTPLFFMKPFELAFWNTPFFICFVLPEYVSLTLAHGKLGPDPKNILIQKSYIHFRSSAFPSVFRPVVSVYRY